MLRTLLAAVVIGNSVIVTAATGDTSRATSIRASAVPVLIAIMEDSFGSFGPSRGRRPHVTAQPRRNIAIDVPDRMR